MTRPTPFRPSANVAAIRPSATIAASAQAAELRAHGREIIDLGAGEPDFPTPSFVRDAAHRALDAGATRYTAVAGIASLRAAIAARATREACGAPVTADQVVVSAGSKQALFNACYSVFGPGDDVLIPTPGWTSYYEIVSLARANAVPVSGAEQKSFKLDPAVLEAAATPNTRGLVINSPCNPTGAVYSASELSAIAELAVARGWWLVSDEIYRAHSYDGDAPSLLSVSTDRDRLIVIDGVAKSFAMTGWRIGWSIAEPEVSRVIAALQSHTTYHATTLAQHAVLAALSDPEAEADARSEMVGELRARRDAALGILRGAGLTVLEPSGAFYLFIKADAGSAARILESQGVVVVPGTAFQAPEWIRMSYAAPRPLVEEGARRIAAVLSGA